MYTREWSHICIEGGGEERIPVSTKRSQTKLKVKKREMNQTLTPGTYALSTGSLPRLDKPHFQSWFHSTNLGRCLQHTEVMSIFVRNIDEHMGVFPHVQT